MLRKIVVAAFILLTLAVRVLMISYALEEKDGEKQDKANKDRAESIGRTAPEAP